MARVEELDSHEETDNRSDLHRVGKSYYEAYVSHGSSSGSRCVAGKTYQSAKLFASTARQQQFDSEK